MSDVSSRFDGWRFSFRGRIVISLGAWAAVGLVIGVGAGAWVRSQMVARVFAQQAAQASQTATPGRVFGSDAGVVLNFVKPDKTADFEAIMAKLKEALQKSAKPVRKQQAASWKVFRALEAGGNGSVLYVFVVDPAVKGADYTVSTILAEEFPTEGQALYKQYAETYASGQNVVNLAKLPAFE